MNKNFVDYSSLQRTDLRFCKIQKEENEAPCGNKMEENEERRFDALRKKTCILYGTAHLKLSYVLMKNGIYGEFYQQLRRGVRK